VACVPAQPSWRTVDFISDLHLHASEPETFRAWQNYMQSTRAQAVFILGDLFEAWVGDDVVNAVSATAGPNDGFEDCCVRILKRCAEQRAVFFMRGNRDFLIGERFTRACDVQLLDDPCVLTFGGQRWLLSHGDALCLDDIDYMRFRAQVRSATWQQEFLAQTLAQRKAIARELRTRSEALKRTNPARVDVDAPQAIAWLKTANATRLIHGHTHRPADHALDGEFQRTVLSDWDLRADPPRAQVLRMTTDASDGPVTVRRLAPDLA
jgi:UDP-2,3-diacylglucosamine hydrolase